MDPETINRIAGSEFKTGEDIADYIDTYRASLFDGDDIMTNRLRHSVFWFNYASMNPFINTGMLSYLVTVVGERIIELEISKGLRKIDE